MKKLAVVAVAAGALLSPIAAQPAHATIHTCSGPVDALCYIPWAHEWCYVYVADPNLGIFCLVEEQP